MHLHAITCSTPANSLHEIEEAATVFGTIIWPPPPFSAVTCALVVDNPQSTSRVFPPLKHLHRAALNSPEALEGHDTLAYLRSATGSVS